MRHYSATIMIIFLCVVASVNCYRGGSRKGYTKSNFGPEVTATKGAVWPRPQQQSISENFFVLRPRTFQFQLVNGGSCSILDNAIFRYWKIIQENTDLLPKISTYKDKKIYKKKWLSDGNFLDYIDELTVNMTGSCDDTEYPNIDMDEKYKLWITEERVELQADSAWGILRGLETFSQLIYLGSDGLSLRINATTIEDFPRFKHRGLLIDTARHYIPLDKIYTTLDALSYNKMNVLHWHIVDDQSFPYVSQAFPELSQLGAYNPYTKIYTPQDISIIIEYAKLRGIRVMPEFDSPGHTASWGVSHPELLTPCEVFSTEGPIDPSKDGTFVFLNSLFTEVKELFKDAFIHLGGDEVEFYCWEANDNITKFMKEQNITTYEGLESYYIQKVVNIANDLKFRSIVWEEVFANGVLLPNETLVHVWKGDWRSTLKNVTSSGKYGLLSACWYLDDLNSGGDWDNFYRCEPTNFDGTPEEQKLVLGGEACMWGEVVNEYNIISRVWPRAASTAEKLWSAYNESEYNLDEPASRLEEHTCRLNRRGIGAQPPNGPGYCD